MMTAISNFYDDDHFLILRIITVSLMIIYKKFTFDSAHFLPNVQSGHKCGTIHGHTYELILFIEGELIDRYGWVIDFGDIKKAVLPIINSVDHKFLNEIPGLENPTSEVLAGWLWCRIKEQLPQLKKIELKETPTSGVIYEG